MGVHDSHLKSPKLWHIGSLSLGDISHFQRVSYLSKCPPVLYLWKGAWEQLHLPITVFLEPKWESLSRQSFWLKSNGFLRSQKHIRQDGALKGHKMTKVTEWPKSQDDSGFPHDFVGFWKARKWATERVLRMGTTEWVWTVNTEQVGGWVPLRRHENG